MIHFGLIFLVLGTLLTAVQQIETSMEITEGETAIYSFDQRDSELIIAYEVDADNEQVVAIPESIYSERKEFNDLKDIPFTFKVKQYYPNTNFFRTEKADMVSAQNGVGTSLMVTKKAKTLKDDELNAPSVIIEVFEDGKSRGTWLLSNLLGAPQKIQVKGKDYRIAIRQRRYYNDFEMKLIDFSHDRYAGTNTPKNFSSDVVITRPDEEAFEYRVYMNHPLRIDGRTYYQASFKDNDTTTIFQVVKNPSWLIPYWSCTIISLGLVVQFMMHLIKFLKKREAKL